MKKIFRQNGAIHGIRIGIMLVPICAILVVIGILLSKTVSASSADDIAVGIFVIFCSALVLCFFVYVLIQLICYTVEMTDTEIYTKGHIGFGKIQYPERVAYTT